MNHYLDDQIETVFLLTDPKYQHLSSSLLKEVALEGGDISAYLPENLNQALQKQIHDRMIERVKQFNEKSRTSSD